MVQGTIFNIQRFSVQDGPGIRTTVFAKGCPMRCLWCSNPESQNANPEVSHRNSQCDRCGRCRHVCDLDAITVLGDGITIDRKRCDNCARCVDACYIGALELIGKPMSIEQVLEDVKKDMLFYRNSGGGMTVSGGEAGSQLEFVEALLGRCQDAGVHTCVDTCGHMPAENMERLVAHADTVLYDVKHLDPKRHLEGTGVHNRQILENLGLVVAKGVPVIVRIPLIPGFNDAADSVAAIAEFVSKLKGVERIDLLAYHRFGVGKYVNLDRPYLMDGTVSLLDEQVQQLKQVVEAFGLECSIGG